MIDTSVAVKLVLPREELTSAAGALLSSDAAGVDGIWVTPDLFDIECASAVASAVRRGRVEGGAGARALAFLLALPIVRRRTSTLVPAAMGLSLDLAVSVYDACYVALADALGVPLVTADEKLVRRLGGTRHAVLHLAAFAS